MDSYGTLNYITNYLILDIKLNIDEYDIDMEVGG